MTVWDTPQNAIQRALELMRRERVRQQSNMAQRQAFAQRTLAPLQPGINAELAALTSKYRAPGGFTYAMPPDVQARVNQLQTGRGFSPSDVGSPTGEPPFPGVVGHIPGLRTPAEAAATIGTAGLGSLPIAAKLGGLAGGFAGAFGGGEAAQQVGLPRPLGEVAGAIPGALIGGRLGSTIGVRAGQAAERAGGLPALISQEAGGTQFAPGPYSRALRTLAQREEGRNIATAEDQIPVEAAVQQHMANTGKTARDLLGEFAT